MLDVASATRSVKRSAKRHQIRPPPNAVALAIPRLELRWSLPLWFHIDTGVRFTDVAVDHDHGKLDPDGTSISRKPRCATIEQLRGHAEQFRG
jgi:hypothetical protein